MTEQEFGEWSAAYFASFPDTHRWLMQAQDPGATLRVWRGVLAETNFQAAMTVTQRMVGGELEPLPAYERERTAAYIKTEAAKITFALQQRKHHEYDAPRVRCATCQDLGTVTVWAKRSVEFAREHGEAPKGRYVEKVACTCHAGDHFTVDHTGKFSSRSIPRYDDAKHCKVEGNTPLKKDMAYLLEWINGEGSGRFTEFDEYSEAI